MEVAAKAELISVKSPSLSTLFSLALHGLKNNKYIVASICMPYKIIDSYPDSYLTTRSLLEKSGILGSKRRETPGGTPKTFRIALHVRRGDIAWYCRERWLDSSYYIKIAMNVVSILQSHGIPFECELHTEAPTRLLRLAKGSHGIPIDGSEVTIDPSQSDLQDFDVIPCLRHFINGNPLDAFQD